MCYRIQEKEVLNFVPEGQRENSPAIYRWEEEGRHPSPGDTVLKVKRFWQKQGQKVYPF